MAETGDKTSRVGPYRILSPLSKGGMARVDLAIRFDGREVCVLKQLHAQLQKDDDATTRFVREARLAALLRHENIAGLIEADVVDDRLYLASELVRGVTFEQINKKLWAQDRRLPLDIALALIQQVLHALDYAHTLRGADGEPLGIVHRDLSSKNLMLGFDGRVKIIDFGVAKGAVDDHRTATGVLMGTPLYMSPEQAAALRVDATSDLYTIGVVLWELVAGRRLVASQARPQMLLSVVRDPAPLIRSIRPDAPAELEGALARALEKDPTDRFSSARDFLRALIPVTARVGVADEGRLAAFAQQELPEKLQELEGLLGTEPLADTALRPASATPAPDSATHRPAAAYAAPTNADSVSGRSSSSIAPPRSRAPLVAAAGLTALVAAVLAGVAAQRSAPVGSEGPSQASPPAASPVPAPPTPEGPEKPAAVETARGAPDDANAESVAPSPSATASPRPEPPPTPRRGTEGRPTSPSADRRSDPPVDAKAETSDALARSAAAAAEAPAPSSPTPDPRLDALLSRYRRDRDVNAATTLYGRLRARAKRVEADEQRCIEAALAALDFVKYDDVESSGPLFAEAVACTE